MAEWMDGGRGPATERLVVFFDLFLISFFSRGRDEKGEIELPVSVKGRSEAALEGA